MEPVVALLLTEGTPAPGGGESGLEVAGPETRREADHAGGAVVFKTSARQESGIAGHGAGVVVAGLGLVKRVGLHRTGRLVAVVHGAGHGQALRDHALVNQVRGERVLKARHGLVVKTLVEVVTGGPRVTGAGAVGAIRALGPGGHESAGCARLGEGAAGFVHGQGVVRADVRHEVVAKDGGERGTGFLFGHDTTEAGAPRPLLAEHLVDVAAVVGARAPLFGFRRVVDKAFSIPQRGHEVFAAERDALATDGGELGVAGDEGHAVHGG